MISIDLTSSTARSSCRCPKRDYLPGIGPQEGRVFRTRRICPTFERAVERAKLENFQVQDCRHTFASRLVMAGISLQAASAPRVCEFSTISARGVFAAVESGGDC